jgi:hypothetical protein
MGILIFVAAGVDNSYCESTTWSTRTKCNHGGTEAYTEREWPGRACAADREAPADGCHTPAPGHAVFSIALIAVVISNGPLGLLISFERIDHIITVIEG